MAAAKRRKVQRTATRIVCAAHLSVGGHTIDSVSPCMITLTRVAPSGGLDPMDALGASMKSIADGIADAFGLKNDRDPRIEWRVLQRRGKQREYAVDVLIESRSSQQIETTRC